MTDGRAWTGARRPRRLVDGERPRPHPDRGRLRADAEAGQAPLRSPRSAARRRPRGRVSLTDLGIEQPRTSHPDSATAWTGQNAETPGRRPTISDPDKSRNSGLADRGIRPRGHDPRERMARADRLGSPGPALRPTNPDATTAGRKVRTAPTTPNGSPDRAESRPAGPRAPKPDATAHPSRQPAAAASLPIPPAGSGQHRRTAGLPGRADRLAPDRPGLPGARD